MAGPSLNGSLSCFCMALALAQQRKSLIRHLSMFIVNLLRTNNAENSPMKWNLAVMSGWNLITSNTFVPRFTELAKYGLGCLIGLLSTAHLCPSKPWMFGDVKPKISFRLDENNCLRPSRSASVYGLSHSWKLCPLSRNTYAFNIPSF